MSLSFPLTTLERQSFVAELVQQLKSRNVDLDRLAAYHSRQQGHHLQQKDATQAMAREVSQLMQSWLPTAAAPDPTSQQRILDLEAQLAELKSQTSQADAGPNSTPVRIDSDCPDHAIFCMVNCLRLRPSLRAPCCLLRLNREYWK